MKKYIGFLLFLAVLASCKKQDSRYQYATDSVPPGAVKAVQVKNIAGGAELSYDLPDDEDLLYVEAVYTRNGKTVKQKASSYGNVLNIEGFGRSQEVKVQLIAYDRSGNASEPVEVSAHPLDSDIYGIFQTLQVQKDFGGIRLDWINENAISVAVAVITPDVNGKYKDVQTFYSNIKAGMGNLRGYPNEPIEFGVYIRDRWGNTTDTLFGTYTPIYEVEMDKSRFARWNPPGIPYNGYTTSNWYIPNAWDNTLTKGFANFSLDFTFDMGHIAKLSRFKIYQRTPPLLYTLGHMRKFQLWGSETPDVNEDTATWKFIGNFESVKPSGLPAGEVSNDDIQYAATDGEPFTVPLSAPPVRYLWVHCTETWGNATVVQFMEMTFWGDDNY